MIPCTAKFCGGGRAVEAKRYHALPLVQNSLGQRFTLQIQSLCFSPWTVGARVQLSKQQLPLFDKPEEKEWNGVQTLTSPARDAGASKTAAKDRSSSGINSKTAKKRPTRSKQETAAPAEDDQCFSAPVQDLKPQRTKPLAKTGTNFDVLRLCDLEAGWRATDADFVPVTGGRARYFGDGVYCVYFDPPLYVNTVYSGFY
ncbi:hypothetical protein ACOMHN_009684 [Nucella lapillus]